VDGRGRAPRVGVSRSTSRNWSNGFKVYRDGEVIGIVPPVDRLAASPISPRFLSQRERIEIADLHPAGQSVRAIAAAVGRSPSTVSRQLRRNGRRAGLSVVLCKCVTGVHGVRPGPGGRGT
jgi:IS30 family transposase